MFFTKTEIVFEMISLIFKSIEGFVLYLPTTPSAAHQDICIITADCKVGNPGKVFNLTGLGIVFFVVQKIYFQIKVCLIK